MANIEIEKLKDDITDRLNNLSLTGQVPKNLQANLQSKARVVQAMNQALLAFIRGASVEALDSLTILGVPLADTDAGPLGVVNNVKVYRFPDDTFAERDNMGLSKVVLNGDEMDVRSGYMSPITTINHCANSSFYGTNHPVFHIDYEYKRIYSPMDVVVKVRYVKYPEEIKPDLTYGVANASAIPISDRYIEDIAATGLQRLIALAMTANTVTQEANEEVSQ